jgi:putative ABC transport system permease protein
MTYLRELIHQVFGSLLRNKLRSFLTMAGIAWGIASIVMIVAMGDGFKAGQRKSMKSLGENIVILFGGRTEKHAGGQRAGKRIRLNYQDVENIRHDCYLVKSAAGEVESNNRATSPYNSGAFDVDGVEPVFSSMRTVPVSAGRFISEQDMKDAARVCVIGKKVREQLFGKRTQVVGQKISIKSLPYEVIGLLQDKNQNSSYSGFDEQKIFVPYSAMIHDIPPKEESYTPGTLDDILYMPRSLDDFADARQQVLQRLARAHQFDATDKAAVNIWDTVENAKQVDGLFQSMTAFLGMIALVTLTLGGVGVMNIMLVTVSERTREVGLRKALGATRLRILIDFLSEGMLLAFLSGLVGWAGAFGLSYALTFLPMPDAFPGLPVRWVTTLVAFGSLTVIALLSSLVPAWNAASLTPVEALRYER